MVGGIMSDTDFEEFDFHDAGPCSLCSRLPKGGSEETVELLRKHGITAYTDNDPNEWGERSDYSNTGCEYPTDDCSIPFICDGCRMDSGQWAWVYEPVTHNGVRSAEHSEDLFAECCVSCFEQLKKDRPDLAPGNWADAEKLH
mgnify:CR=1 FL=1